MVQLSAVLGCVGGLVHLTLLPVLCRGARGLARLPCNRAGTACWKTELEKSMQLLLRLKGRLHCYTFSCNSEDHSSSMQAVLMCITYPYTESVNDCIDPVLCFLSEDATMKQ